MTKLHDLKERLLADPATKAEYEAQGAEFEIAETLIRARRDGTVADRVSFEWSMMDQMKARGCPQDWTA